MEGRSAVPRLKRLVDRNNYWKFASRVAIRYKWAVLFEECGGVGDQDF